MARDYTSIITSQYSDSPNFQAVVAQLGAIFGANYDLLSNIVPTYYDLDSAVGVQLDQIGLWVGASRRLAVPLNIYFSLDTPGLGLDQGVWKGPYDPDTGLVLLDDETFRSVIRGVILFNNWDGSLFQYNAIFAAVFRGTGTHVHAKDNQNMTMDMVITGTPVSAVMQAEMTAGQLHIKPVGVSITGYTFP